MPNSAETTVWYAGAMETATKAEHEGKDCPQCGYCIVGTANNGRCPECGSSLGLWTTRWRASDAASGLELLAWGLPLLLVAIAAATVCRWIMEYAPNATLSVVVYSRTTLLLCIVPGAMCLIGMLQLRMSRSGRMLLPVLLATATMLCLTLSVRYGHHRFALGKTSEGDWHFLYGWRHMVGTVSGLLMVVGGVCAAWMAGASVIALGREFQMRLRVVVIASLALLLFAIARPVLDDVWIHLTSEGPTKPAGGPGMMDQTRKNSTGHVTYTTVRNDVVWRSSDQLGRHDGHIITAGPIGVAGLWAAVILVRARVRFDERNRGPRLHSAS